MIPISDDNPTLRTPIVTWAILTLLGAVWIFVQGMGAPAPLLRSICTYGLIPAELTGAVQPGTEVPLGLGARCVLGSGGTDALVALVTSMFMHGSWGHLLGNGLFLWVFGNNIEDSLGRVRFIIFYLLCGLVAAGAQVLVHPDSVAPMVGASGAISGVMGAYLVLYPLVRVRMLFIIVFLIRIIELPAYVVLLFWFGYQVLLGLPQLAGPGGEVSAGVAFWAHIGGFVAGLLLVKPFENRRLVRRRIEARHRLHPFHP